MDPEALGSMFIWIEDSDVIDAIAYCVAQSIVKMPRIRNLPYGKLQVTALKKLFFFSKFFSFYFFRYFNTLLYFLFCNYPAPLFFGAIRIFCGRFLKYSTKKSAGDILGRMKAGN